MSIYSHINPPRNSKTTSASASHYVSPLQKPILKHSTYDVSPISRKTTHNRPSSSFHTSFLDSTHHTSFHQPSEPPTAHHPPLPSPRNRNKSFTRAQTADVDTPLDFTRRRAVTAAFNKAVNRTVIVDQSNIMENSFQLNSSLQMNNSFLDVSFHKENHNKDDKKHRISISTFMGSTAGTLRSRVSTADRTERGRKDRFESVRKNLSLNRISEQTSDANIEKVGRKVEKEYVRKNSVLKKAIGSLDSMKKDRFVRFLEMSVKRIFRTTESPKKEEKSENENPKMLDTYNMDSFAKRRMSKIVDKEVKSGMKSENKEVRLMIDKKDKIEYTFYKETNDMLQFCVKENSIALFLKTMKLLVNLYLTYEKLDEGFHCLNQLRWASEYLAMYKEKTEAFIKMAECCKMVEKYDEAIKLLRKALQYAWEYDFISQEMKAYDALGKIYYLKGEIKKAYYYNERFCNGISEPKNSPLREIYHGFLEDTAEIGRFEHFKSLDEIMSRLTFPLISGENKGKCSLLSTTMSSFNIEDQKKKEVEKYPSNIKNFQDQLNSLMGDTEMHVPKKKPKADADDGEERKKEAYDGSGPPSPTFKTNLAELDPGKNYQQKIRDLRLKEERLTGVIRNAKKDLRNMFDDDDRKKRMQNIIQLQIAFQREKRLVLGHQQDFRVHVAKLLKSQYHVFESKVKPAIVKTNMKTESDKVMENKHNMDLEDPDYFQGVKKKMMTLRFENNMPPFLLLTHKRKPISFMDDDLLNEKKKKKKKKLPPKPVKKDSALLNEKAKKIYLKFYKKIMKKIAPERGHKIGGEDL